MKKAFLGLIAASMLVACHSKNSSTTTDTSKAVQAASTPVTSSTEGTVSAPGTAKPTTTKADTANAPVIAFEKSSFDFGKIKQGDKVSYDFKFTNTGKSPLIISDAVASCGCTKPEWPKTPVAPGDKGIIKVVFNSAGKSGLQDKLITITGNTLPAQSLVHLVGEVTSTDAKK